MKYIFIISIALLVYSYIIYPLLMFIISKLKYKKRNSYSLENIDYPKVSLILAAYNEEEFIEQKVKNIREAFSGYKGKYEVLIGSDGSADKTNQILSEYLNEDSFFIYLFDRRRGKISVLNDLVSKSTGEILLFTDTSAMFTVETISNLSRHFSDESIGGVGGVKKINPSMASNNVKKQEGIYWKIEEITKKGESALNKLVGADGQIYAIRKKLFRNFPTDTILDDFCISMHVSKNAKFIYDVDAIAYEEPGKSYSEEYKRRVRMSSGAYQAIFRNKFLLVPFDKLSILFISHKVIRWFSPLLMLLVLISNIFLMLDYNFLKYVFYLQILIYLATFITHYSNYAQSKKLISFIYHFISSNLFQIKGFINYIKKSSKNSSVLWDKTEK